MAKFKVGDKVLVRIDIEAGNEYRSDGDKRKDGCLVVRDMARKAGGVVTITGVKEYETYTRYLIAEDNYYWADRMFEGLAENPKIVITTDGKTTLARLYNGKELIKKAEAKCSPDDKFDFVVGAELAMERLIGKNPATSVNPFKVGDFVRIKSNKDDYHCFPAGSVGRVIEADSDGTCDVDGFYKSGNRGTQWVKVEELEKV